MRSMPSRTLDDDTLLSPQNAALLIIDYQPSQIYTAVSADPDSLIPNVVSLAKTARLFDLPIVLSTVQVSNGVNADTVPQLRAALPGEESIDRTAINAWEDQDFVDAVRATGRRKLIIAALWTEVCLVFPGLSAIDEGFDVYPVVDCVAGTSQVAHETGIQRLIHAGARPVTWVSVLCELQRDWNRRATADGIVEIALERGGAWGTEIALKPEGTAPVAA
jgi:nicotinamidase-related amidase